ncbi:MAG: hypothetical protein MZV64_71175 [Ignavibacteriales bacterium]|nr:hypothetical protein [Ignavibacteriales bacterium]
MPTREKARSSLMSVCIWFARCRVSAIRSFDSVSTCPRSCRSMSFRSIAMTRRGSFRSWEAT